jgi:hypothetical protein
MSEDDLVVCALLAISLTGGGLLVLVGLVRGRRGVGPGSERRGSWLALRSRRPLNCVVFFFEGNGSAGPVFLCRSGQVNASRERETFLDKQTGNHWEIGTGRDKKGWVLNKNRNQDGS